MGDVEATTPITKEFLENILKRKVVSFKTSSGSNPGDNFMTILISLEVVVEDAKEPLYLLYKTFPNHPTRQKILEDTNIFLKEYQVYNEWLPELNKFQKSILDNGKLLKLAMPEMVAGSAIDYTDGTDKDWVNRHPMLNNFVLMVDVRKTYGYQMADKLKPFGYHHIKVVLEELAKYNALGHAYKFYNKLVNIRGKFPYLVDLFFCNPSQRPNLQGFLKTNLQSVQEICKDFLNDRPEIAMSLKQFHDSEKAAEYLEIFVNPEGMDEEKVEGFMRVQPKGVPLKDQWIVTGHGDCWSNNMLFKKDENGTVTSTVLVDLQLMRESCIMADLVYFLYTSTDAHFRKQYLDEMLGWFCERFVHFCGILKVSPFPGFTLDNFRRKFHRSKIFGFLFAIIINATSLRTTETSLNLDSVEVEGTGQDDDWVKLVEKMGRNEEDSRLLRERMTGLLVEMYDEGIL